MLLLYQGLQPDRLAVAMTLVSLQRVFWLLPNQAPVATSQQAPFLSSRQILLQPVLLPYFVLTLLSYGAVQLYFSYFNVWLVGRLAWDPAQLAQGGVVVSLSMMFGSLLGGKPARQWRGISYVGLRRLSHNLQNRQIV